MIGFLILSGCDAPGSGTVGTGAEGLRVRAEGPAACPEEEGEKDPRSESPASPAPTAAGSQGTRRRRARRGCFPVPSSRPQMHATISTDSGKNPHNPPRPEIPTLGMSGWGGPVSLGRHNLHGAQVPAGLEHLTRGLPVRGAGATSRSSCTLPATGLRPALARAPGPCVPCRVAFRVRCAPWRLLPGAVAARDGGGRASETREGPELEGEESEAGGGGRGSRKCRSRVRPGSAPDLENSRCPCCGSRSSQPMALRGTGSRRGKKLGTRVSLDISGALGTRSRGLQKIDASACYPPA